MEQKRALIAAGSHAATPAEAEATGKKLAGPAAHGLGNRGGGVNFKPENTACLLKATCKRCKETLVVPAQMTKMARAGPAYRVTFGKCDHKEGCDNKRRPAMQTEIGMPSPGETKSACKGELLTTLP